MKRIHIQTNNDEVNKVLNDCMDLIDDIHYKELKMNSRFFFALGAMFASIIYILANTLF